MVGVIATNISKHHESVKYFNISQNITEEGPYFIYLFLRHSWGAYSGPGTVQVTVYMQMDYGSCLLICVFCSDWIYSSSVGRDSSSAILLLSSASKIMRFQEDLKFCARMKVTFKPWMPHFYEIGFWLSLCWLYKSIAQYPFSMDFSPESDWRSPKFIGWPLSGILWQFPPFPHFSSAQFRL